MIPTRYNLSTDVPEDDPFPFLFKFDEREMEQGRKTVLLQS
jgi:hypothetical protein